MFILCTSEYFYTHFIVAEDKYMSQKCRRYGVVFNVSRGYLNRVTLAFGCGFVLVPLILRNNRVILFGGQSPYIYVCCICTTIY